MEGFDYIKLDPKDTKTTELIEADSDFLLLNFIRGFSRSV